MFYSVDRIEDEIAVCIDGNGEVHEISIFLIDGEIAEGSIIASDEYGGYYVDENETESRRKSNFDLAESLFDE